MPDFGGSVWALDVAVLPLKQPTTDAGAPKEFAPVLSLTRLTDIIACAEKRSYAFEAIRQLLEHFPDESEHELASLLGNSSASERSKAIVLYYLQEHGRFGNLLTAHIDPLRLRVNDIEKDIETFEDDGIDPFRTEGFPEK